MQIDQVNKWTSQSRNKSQAKIKKTAKTFVREQLIPYRIPGGIYEQLDDDNFQVVNIYKKPQTRWRSK